jgi:hypothetical protein
MLHEPRGRVGRGLLSNYWTGVTSLWGHITISPPPLLRTYDAAKYHLLTSNPDVRVPSLEGHVEAECKAAGRLLEALGPRAQFLLTPAALFCPLLDPGFREPQLSHLRELMNRRAGPDIRLILEAAYPAASGTYFVAEKAGRLEVLMIAPDDSLIFLEGRPAERLRRQFGQAQAMAEDRDLTRASLMHDEIAGLVV